MQNASMPSKQKHVKYKLFYALIAVLLAVNVIEFFIINSYSAQAKTELESYEKAASSESTTSEQFLLKEIEGCPNKISGNPDAILKIKYFYNELCPYCRMEVPVLDSLISKRGNLFFIEMFDTDKCREDSIKEGVNRIPFFVFMVNGEKNSGGGVVAESDLEKFICEVTQAC